MRLIPAWLMYVHFPTIGKILYLNCYKYFSWRRALFSLVFLFAIFLQTVIVAVFRLLDEILLPFYRLKKIKAPVFIISNPRSGTTFLHRLFTQDEERFTYTLLYHTIFPAASLILLIRGIGYLERPIGRPLHRLMNWISRKAFKGWDDIHRTGLNESEEDEGLFIFSQLTAAVCLWCPFPQHMQHLVIPDRLPERTRSAMQSFYFSSLRRILFAMGGDKTLLMKNVMTTGRFHTLVQAFPDARVIYITRHPYKAVPSFISMFTAPWPIHSPDLPETGPETEAMGRIITQYYEYFNAVRQTHPPKHFQLVEYDDLVADPKQFVLDLYAGFDMPVSPAFEQRLDAMTTRNRKYKSKHSYSLEQYGLSEAWVRANMPESFEALGFEA